jgi:transketolase
MTDPHTRVQLDLSVPELEKMARHLRRQVISMIANAGSGHPGGSLSAADIITALYFKLMCHDPANPNWPDRDRFVLSKGHAAPILYATLAECGYFPVEELSTLRKLGSRLQGHTDRNLTPGIEMSAGSLGQGLSYSIGIALAGRLDKRDYHVYVMLGDGECDEGQIWEAAMFAPHHRIDNLTAIVDYNAIQLDGRVCDIMGLEPLIDKWRAFNWHVLEIDGHNMSQIIDSLQKTKTIKGCPTVIIAHTIKGKGVSFMENNVAYHGKAPSPQDTAIALKELE